MDSGPSYNYQVDEGEILRCAQDDKHEWGTSQHELGIPFRGFILSLMAVSVVYTGGSIWTAIFFHWIGTYGMQVVSTGITCSPGYNRLEYLPVILIAVVLMVWWKPWEKRAVQG